ncbi:hypothetical protein [Aneurinibacillus sp. REN35]|uniref:hypothetical protein n=1 Tax=Aneurinibacillus sp. REN35 TaxID=3237286 RepID=UPI003526D677
MSEQGLHVKYNVTKADTGELIGNCFVLRPDRDPAAVVALMMYAAATENKELSQDILNWLQGMGQERLLYTQCFLKAISENPQFFEKLLGSIIESPFQSEHGDMWVNKKHATAVCSELYYAVMDERFYENMDFQALADESDELLHIVD